MGVRWGSQGGGGQTDGFGVRMVLLAVDGRICDAGVGDGHDSCGPRRCAGLKFSFGLDWSVRRGLL